MTKTLATPEPNSSKNDWDITSNITEAREIGNRFFSRFYVRLVIVAAGTLTGLLGLKNVWEYDVSRIAFVLSAAVTAVTTWDAFADHHWKWIRYRAVLHQLFALRDELKYRMVGEVLPTQAEFDEFFERLQATVKELDEE
jgi:hypothetical protein